jgi:hypothetical protein
MHLADDVLPAVALWQWALSFPHPGRFHLAYDAHLCAAVRRIYVRTLLGWLAQQAERTGVVRARSSTKGRSWWSPAPTSSQRAPAAISCRTKS